MLRIGILGATETAIDAICTPALHRADITLVAIAARDPIRAAQFAFHHRIKNVEPDYGALLARKDIDLIYIPLIPSLHHKWAVAALNSGKHVLVEKPAALSSAELKDMMDAAQQNGVRLIEAFHHRYHPAYEQFLRVLSTNRLGNLKSVHVEATTPIHFCPTSFRHRPNLGGGVIYDIGCYPIFWLRDIIGNDLEDFEVRINKHSTGVDETVQLSALSPHQTSVSLFTSMAPHVDDAAHIYIEGERGTLRFTNPLAPHNGHCFDLTIDGTRRRFTVAGETSYDHQLARLVSALKHGHMLPTEGAPMLTQMKFMEKVLNARACCSTVA